MKAISPLLLLASVAVATTPSEFDFLKTLLPASKHISTEIVSGRFSGSIVSIYRGKDSLENVAAALEKNFGKKLTPEKSDPSWQETARIFGQAGLGDATGYKRYTIDRLRFSIFTFELRLEGPAIQSVLIITDSE
jgi:hypothetical protein